MSGRTARRRVLRISLPGDAGEQPGPPRGPTCWPPRSRWASGSAARRVTLTMRTPGDDIDLAAGFLVSEGMVGRAGRHRRDHDLRRAALRPRRATTALGNIADVTLRPGLAAAAGLRRSFLTTSACGVCGKTSIEELAVASRFDLAADQARVTPEVLAGLPDALRAAQRVFESHRRAARGRAVHRGRRAAGRARGRGPAQRGRQDRRLGAAVRPAAAGRLRAAGQRAGLVRAGAEGGAGRDPGAGRGVGAVLAGRRPGRRSRG